MKIYTQNERFAQQKFSLDFTPKDYIPLYFHFFLLFIVLENNGAFPFLGPILNFINELFQQIIPWIAKHILHLSNDITIFTNGSGDTTYDYLMILTIFVTALLGTIIWTIAGRNKLKYATLYYWFTVAIRYYLALTLITYGFIKVFKLQFPAPGLYRLTETYGESSPMGLAWTFLGFSKGYNFFMGIAELASILLLFRRTMTLGAIICLMTTANVMAVNYFYDVPVKIVSTALFTMSALLLFNDAKNLFNFFFTSQPASLTIIPAPEIKRKWLRIGKVLIKVLLIAFILIGGFFEFYNSEKKYGDNAPKPKFYGFYILDKFVVNKDSSQIVPDSQKWKYLTIEAENFARIRYMNDSVGRFRMKMDTIAKKLEFKAYTDSTKKYSLNYQIPKTEKLLLTGKFANDSIYIRLNRTVVDQKNFRLMNRGFHWINEYPYNR